MPINIVKRIPHSIDPFTFFISNTEVMASPISAKSGEPEVILPSVTKVASFLVITPAFCNPMKAIKSPIPAPMAFFRESGMALRMASRKLERVSRINRRPSISTAVNANSQVLPIPRQTVKAKKAFSPMPGASANGSLAHTAIIRVAIKEAVAVAVNTAPLSMPVTPSMLGFTARMYDIVRNVVIPARISVLTCMECELNPNNFCSIFLFSIFFEYF